MGVVKLNKLPVLISTRMGRRRTLGQWLTDAAMRTCCASLGTPKWRCTWDNEDSKGRSCTPVEQEAEAQSWGASTNRCLGPGPAAVKTLIELATIEIRDLDELASNKEILKAVKEAVKDYSITADAINSPASLRVQAERYSRAPSLSLSLSPLKFLKTISKLQTRT